MPILKIEIEYDGQFWSAQIASNDLSRPLEYVNQGSGDTVSEAIDDLLAQVRDVLDESGRDEEE